VSRYNFDLPVVTNLSSIASTLEAETSMSGKKQFSSRKWRWRWMWRKCGCGGCGYGGEQMSMKIDESEYIWMKVDEAK